jgi:hypothetical protein
MSHPETKKPEMKLLPSPVMFCRRLQRTLLIADHKTCPYCFGDEQDVRSGDYARFCDFKRGEDPVNLGFPSV